MSYNPFFEVARIKAAIIELEGVVRRLAEPIDRQRGGIVLPVFSHDIDPPGWLGASYITRQYNYTIAERTSFPKIPLELATRNFCLCIRYRVGGVVTRYKLNSGVGEFLFVDLYDGQIIEKNFVLEVWTTNGEDILSNADEIVIDTSIMHFPTGDPLDNNSAAADEGELAADLFGALPFDGTSEPVGIGSDSAWITN